MYIPCDTAIESVGNSTVIKQQWVMLKQQNKKSLIKEIIERQKEKHEIMLTIDGNESFLSSS